MATEEKRLLMQFEQLLRTTNRRHLNETIDELCINDLTPIADLVARARTMYLKRMYDLAKKYEGSEDFPTTEEIKALNGLRQRYMALVDGSQSFEICIERGYLDLKS